MRGRGLDYEEPRLRQPRNNSPAPNQGGFAAPQGPKSQVVVPNRTGGPTGRPPIVGRPGPPAWRETAGGNPRGTMNAPTQRKIQDDPRFRALDRPAQIKIERSGNPWQALESGGGSPVGPPQAPKIIEGGGGILKHWSRLKQVSKEGEQPQEEEKQPYIGHPSIPEQQPGEKKPGEEEQPYVDETGTPLQPGGVPSKQLPGAPQKSEYTVGRPMTYQELQTSPDGIINTPHAMLEKGLEGLKVRGLTPEGEMRMEKLRLEDTEKFGEWGDKMDPSAPKPPVRPGMRAFNPMTGQWINNDEESILEKLGGGG